MGISHGPYMGPVKYAMDDDLDHLGMVDSISTYAFQLTTQKDYAVHLIRTPDQEAEEGEETTSNTAVDIDAVDEIWVATHAQQVSTCIWSPSSESCMAQVSLCCCRCWGCYLGGWASLGCMRQELRMTWRMHSTSSGRSVTGLHSRSCILVVGLIHSVLFFPKILYAVHKALSKKTTLQSDSSELTEKYTLMACTLTKKWVFILLILYYEKLNYSVMILSSTFQAYL